MPHIICHNEIEWVMCGRTLWKYYKREILFFPFNFVVEVWRTSNNVRFNVFWGGNNQLSQAVGILKVA